jgi:hypothetical protein
VPNKKNQSDALRLVIVIVFAKTKIPQKHRQTSALLFAALYFSNIFPSFEVL